MRERRGGARTVVGRWCGRAIGALAATFAAAPTAGAQVIDARMHHLRSGAQREWEEFDEKAEGAELVVHFQARAGAADRTLRLRQRDVKQSWQVTLNGQKIGPLEQDENEIRRYLAVRSEIPRDGDNELRIACEAGKAEAPDDVAVGVLELIDRPRKQVLSEASARVEVVDAETGAPLPSRVTVVDASGALATTGNQSANDQAVRPGVLYLGNGTAKVSLPSGHYTLYAGRGFEYSVASEKLDLKPGDSPRVKLAIRRVVPTDGYVSCDTHVHTLFYSRHGDATLDERMLTLAGEGIELPVATEHNLAADYSAAAHRLALDRYFTPVTGNELTTATLGHFNVFPLPRDAKALDFRPRDWPAIARNIAAVAPPETVVVLNHARDNHGGFIPLDPRHHISIAGEPLDGVYPPANAMEIVNSGATRADPLELFRDYVGLLNRGRRLTPVGASDSHDVARYIVGQARTYVSYSPDADPSHIDTPRAVRAVLDGHVAVSYGLLATLTIGGAGVPPADGGAGVPPAGPGDLFSPPASSTAPLTIDVKVLGPEWTTATRVALYVNGVEADHADIAPPADPAHSAGVKWQGTFTLPRPTHDVHVIALATGPGVTAPYWPMAKPYQPTSPEYTPHTLALTAPVYIDADHNGHFDSPYAYAQRLVTETNADPQKLAQALAAYDEPTATQAASVLRARDPQHFESLCHQVITIGPPQVSRGVTAYLDEWKLARP